MKALNIVFGALVAMAASAAQAQSTVDVTKITCSQFLFDKIAPTKSIAVWLSGYYNGLQRNTVIDLNRMDQNIDKVEDYCRLHLETTLMDAAKAALDAGK
jgi:acid stress chaperone HdeB